ncbi:amidohydrolase family protein [Sneathiella aquimaris]|uniref:amidohydrolase family protein n=1 Tax=Sneathiella aquimaris TaxID=2599305 RepID=UPI00146E2764|nr:amidohydrolase family protein [Sneathiella aquimaris]
MGLNNVELREEVGALIYREYQANKTKLAAKDIVSFLHSSGGFDLIFWALSHVFSKHLNIPLSELYRVSKNWQDAQRPHEFGTVIDIHTHCVRDSHSMQDRAGYFRMGGFWWFCPERFRFIEETNGISPQAHTQGLLGTAFTSGQYIEDMFGAKEDTNIAILTSAPPSTDPIEENWLIDADEIQDVCAKANRIQSHGKLYSAGRILIGSNSGSTNGFRLDPHSEEKAKKMRFWKIYSGSNWNATDTEWLCALGAGGTPPNGTGGAFDKLRSFGDISNVICIHWAKNHDDTLLGSSGNDLERSEYAQVVNIVHLAERNKDMNFVIFHGGYNQHSVLADITKRYENVFIEIGAIFSGLVCRLNNPLDLKRFVEPLLDARPGSVLWGTDSVWYGSPQWQIEAFKRLKLLEDKEKERAFKVGVLRENAKALFGVS